MTTFRVRVSFDRDYIARDMAHYVVIAEHASDAEQIAMARLPYAKMAVAFRLIDNELFEITGEVE